jgi:hypothetical protein
MAGHSPSKTGVNALMSRPSTTFLPKKQDVDARHKAGHDGFLLAPAQLPPRLLAHAFPVLALKLPEITPPKTDRSAREARECIALVATAPPARTHHDRPPIVDRYRSVIEGSLCDRQLEYVIAELDPATHDDLRQTQSLEIRPQQIITNARTKSGNDA